ncbi:translation machinery-associated protein 16 [Podospora appendiculata]|uniref:Translation machinery-associated protein 16 n=1 Tax=Podospora appendiculata TaxID=314037 RepID=A0AAE1CDJ9_9PEZI|nr:translation machinery-associated protein 16 [Podospora appendiculata]
MAKTLEKTRKKIAKKRNGAIEALHQHSRDSKRLHTAQVRDDRLDKVARLRRRTDKILLQRVAFFQEVCRENENKPLELQGVHTAINEFVHQFDEEYDQVRKERRPGRPASMREDLLKMRIEALLREQKDGFYMPDISNEANVVMLDRWEGSWAYLPNLVWIKISAEGTIRPSKFPLETTGK